jgi:LacI family gluconate utilization system Gnt-I transcriptional repressor
MDGLRTRSRSGGGITVADVAKLAGVSPITVSRAINTPTRVSAEKLERVRNAVAESGYVPNLLAGGLASRRSRLVAALVPNLDCPTYATVVRAMTEELYAAHYQIALGLSGTNGASEDELVEAMLSRRPDGVVITGAVHSPLARQRLAAAGIPVVEMWGHAASPVDMQVGISHQDVGRAVAEALLKPGRTRPVLITEDEPLAAQRAEGFKAAAAALGIERVPMRTLPSGASIGAARAALVDLLDELPDTDAVACSSDLLALGVLIEAAARGMHVPSALAVIGFGDFSYAADTDPPLTTVKIDAAAIGRQAARFVLDQAAGRPITSRAVEAPFEVVRRASA